MSTVLLQWLRFVLQVSNGTYCLHIGFQEEAARLSFAPGVLSP